MTATVREVMTPDVVSIAPETPFKEIARRIVDDHAPALPVVADGRVVGIVSETDLLHKEEFKTEGPTEDEYRTPLRSRLRRTLGTTGSVRDKAEAETASGLMSQKLVTVHPEDSVVAAARAMDRFDVRQLPVVDRSGILLGLVSRRDLLRVFVRADEDVARDIGTEIAEAPAWLEAGRLHFTVNDGTVTIEGRLEQHSHCNIIVKLVQRVDGVVAVHNKLRWNVDDLLPPGTPHVA